MKTFNHCDENFLSLDSIQKTSLLQMAEKAFSQMGKRPPVQPESNDRLGVKADVLKGLRLTHHAEEILAPDFA